MKCVPPLSEFLSSGFPLLRLPNPCKPVSFRDYGRQTRPKTPCSDTQTICSAPKHRVLAHPYVWPLQNTVFWHADDPFRSKTPCSGTPKRLAVPKRRVLTRRHVSALQSKALTPLCPPAPHSSSGERTPCPACVEKTQFGIGNQAGQRTTGKRRAKRSTHARPHLATPGLPNQTGQD